MTNTKPPSTSPSGDNRASDINDLAEDVGVEVAEALNGTQSEEEALVHIDEIMGNASGTIDAQPAPSPEMLAAAQAARWEPRDDDDIASGDYLNRAGVDDQKPD